MVITSLPADPGTKKPRWVRGWEVKNEWMLSPKDKAV